MSGAHDRAVTATVRQSPADVERARQQMLMLESRRLGEHRRRCGQSALLLNVASGIAGFVALSAWFSLITTPNGTDASVAWIVMSACAVACAGFAYASRRMRGLLDVPLFMKDDEASAALASLSLLLAELKRDGRTHESMVFARDRAAQHLQAIYATPLTKITKGSYDPNEHGFDEQWDHLRGAIGYLDRRVASSVPQTVEQIEDSVRLIVRRLRPMLACYDLEGSIIDLHGAPLTALATPERSERPGKPRSSKAKVKAAARPTLPAAIESETSRETKVPMADGPLAVAPVAGTIDAFTPVEGMLNVSADMSVASIRMLTLRLRTIDRTLMPDLDVQSSDLLVDQHIPSLVKAYQVAHDLAPVDERDDVRAEFARTLRVVRDTLTDVLERHAREARRLLENEGRFLAARSGQGDI